MRLGRGAVDLGSTHRACSVANTRALALALALPLAGIAGYLGAASAAVDRAADSAASPAARDAAHVPFDVATIHQAGSSSPSSVAAVAELTLREGPNGDVTDASAYRLTSDQDVLAWPNGAAWGGLESGIGVIALPDLFVRQQSPGQYSHVAITNVVQQPGFTDFVMPISDQNGLLDYVCDKLNEGQSEYIDLATWGYVNQGFKGSAFVSAMFWEHRVYQGGELVRNLVGLTATVVDWSTFAGSRPASAAASRGIPLDLNLGIPFSPWNWHLPPVCGSGPAPIVRTPTPGPSPTASDTPTVTPTPTVTATPIAPPPYAPDAPELHLPALGRQTEGAACAATVEVKNLGADETRGVLVLWGADSSCGDSCAGPVAVQCTGVIPADGGWSIGADDLPEGAHSGVLFSFTTRSLHDIGVDSGSDGAVADALCETLSARLPGDCEEYRRFKTAYDRGLPYEGIPMDRAWGSPLGAEVQRECDDVTGPDGMRLGSAYTAVSGPAVGYGGAADTGFEYTLPAVHAASLAGGGSVAHLQSAGTECASVELWVRARDTCAQPTLCAAAAVAPGESVMVDIAACLSGMGSGAGAGSAWVTSTGPLAIAVDTAAHNALATYMGAPPSLLDMHGSPLLGASGEAAFAPLVYSNYLGWTTTLVAQNTGTITSVLKVSVIDRSGDTLGARQLGPVCPGGSVAIDIAGMAGVPYDFVGSARIESYPQSAAPVATMWLGPEATSTPRATPPGTMPPWVRPTRTPGPPGPVTPGTPEATPTASATRVPLPTSTALVNRAYIYLPFDDR